jgi:hypothetical protein
MIGTRLSEWEKTLPPERLIVQHRTRRIKPSATGCHVQTRFLRLVNPRGSRHVNGSP